MRFVAETAPADHAILNVIQPLPLFMQPAAGMLALQALNQTAQLKPAVVHALARFVGVNRELCELIEEIQAWEKSNEGRGFNRGDASL